MSFGFVFMTVGVISGSAWAFIESGTGWIGDRLIYLVMVFDCVQHKRCLAQSAPILIKPRAISAEYD